MRKKIFSFLAIFAMIAILLGLLYANCEPERCALCGFIKSHAPCLVNVKTGEVEEMALYEPHYTLVGEIAEEQTDSTFSFVDIAGARGTRLSSPFIMELEIPINGTPVIKQHFCKNCRSLLAGHKGYVIADLYVPGVPIIYGISNGMQLTIRCYTVGASLSENGSSHSLVIKGTYN